MLSLTRPSLPTATRTLSDHSISRGSNSSGTSVSIDNNPSSPTRSLVASPSSSPSIARRPNSALSRSNSNSNLPPNQRKPYTSSALATTALSAVTATATADPIHVNVSLAPAPISVAALAAESPSSTSSGSSHDDTAPTSSPSTRYSPSPPPQLDRDRNVPLDELTAPVLKPRPTSKSSSAVLEDDEEMEKENERMRAIDSVRHKDVERAEKRKRQKDDLAHYPSQQEQEGVSTSSIDQNNTKASADLDGGVGGMGLGVGVISGMEMDPTLAPDVGFGPSSGDSGFGTAPMPVSASDFSSGEVALSSSYGSYVPAVGPFPRFRTPSPSIDSNELNKNVFGDTTGGGVTGPAQDEYFDRANALASNQILFDSIFSNFEPTAILGASWDPWSSDKPAIEIPLHNFLNDNDMDANETDTSIHQTPNSNQNSRGLVELAARMGHHPSTSAAPSASSSNMWQTSTSFNGPGFNLDLSLGLGDGSDRSRTDQGVHRSGEDDHHQHHLIAMGDHRSSSLQDAHHHQKSGESPVASSASSTPGGIYATHQHFWHPPLVPPIFSDGSIMPYSSSHQHWPYGAEGGSISPALTQGNVTNSQSDDESSPEIPNPERRGSHSQPKSLIARTPAGGSKKNRNPHATQPPNFMQNTGSPDKDKDGKPKCFNCGTLQTPLWRRGNNEELLCNACGLYLKLHKVHRPKSFSSNSKGGSTPRAQNSGGGGGSSGPRGGSGSGSGGGGVSARRASQTGQVKCNNCEATTTPMWRKLEGKILCNACALYAKLHHAPRPPTKNGERRKRSKTISKGPDTPQPTTSSRRHSESDVHKNAKVSPTSQAANWGLESGKQQGRQRSGSGGHLGSLVDSPTEGTGFHEYFESKQQSPTPRAPSHSATSAQPAWGIHNPVPTTTYPPMSSRSYSTPNALDPTYSHASSAAPRYDSSYQWTNTASSSGDEVREPSFKKQRLNSHSGVDQPATFHYYQAPATSNFTHPTNATYPGNPRSQNGNPANWNSSNYTSYEGGPTYHSAT